MSLALKSAVPTAPVTINEAKVQNLRRTHVEGGLPRRERPWAAVIPKRLAAEASWVPSGRTKKQSTWSIYNPQASARKLDNRPNPLFAGLRSEPAMCPRGLRGVSAQTTEKACLFQTRTFNLGERTCRRRAWPYATDTLRAKASSSPVPGHRPARSAYTLIFFGRKSR